MAENEQKAMALVAEAEKKLGSSKTFLGGLFGSVDKINFTSIHNWDTGMLKFVPMSSHVT